MRVRSEVCVASVAAAAVEHLRHCGQRLTVIDKVCRPHYTVSSSSFFFGDFFFFSVTYGGHFDLIFALFFFL